MNSENSDLKPLDGSFVISWVVKTIMAIIGGIAVGVAVAQLSFCSHNVAWELAGSVLLGAIVGAFVGVAQSTEIRKVVHNPRLWVIASIGGWAIAIFLFEVNWPISRCLTSSNAPSYVPGHLIETVHRPIFIIAEQIERMIQGDRPHGDIYIAVQAIVVASFMGIILGLPQGMGQWLVLRKDMPQSSMMIWVNALIWVAVFLLIIFVIPLMDFTFQTWIIMLPILFMIPAAVTALVLVRLQKKSLQSAA